LTGYGAKMKDILVITGGGGFCGTHLAEHFVSRFRVRLFDSFRRDSLRFVPHLAQSPDVEITTGDVLDSQAVRAALEGASAVIHCAAIAGVSNYYDRPIDTLRVNIIGALNTLDAAAKARVPRFIYFSTSEIYGPHANAVSETAPPTSGPVSDRRWVYSISKLSGEHATLRYGETYGINATTVRPFNIYGPRQTGEGAISNFARRLVQGQPIEIYGDGSDVRSWCHVKDLVTAIDLMFKNEAAFGTSFNIGNPDARVSTSELAQTMIALHGLGSIEQVPQIHSPIGMRTPDITKARSLLGFAPQIGLKEGLKDTLEWFAKERP
jgi:nucleoside-diphosphate-sugar epimerase